jgi:hypothetical protein
LRQLERYSTLYLANFPRNYSLFFSSPKKKKREKKNVTKPKKNETILAA